MPGGFLAYALAGAATGAGTGMINEARAKRDAVMEELREQRLMAREDRQFGRQMQLQDRQFDRQDARDEAQHNRILERDAFKHSLDTTGGMLGEDGAMSPVGVSSDQQRQIDLIMQRYSDFDPMSGTYVVNDWDGLRESLLQVDGGPQYYRQLFGELPRPASPSELATPQPMPQDRNQLVDGQTYRLRDGTEAVYNGREGVFEAPEAGDEDHSPQSQGSGSRSPSRTQSPAREQATPRSERAAEWDIRQSPAATALREAAQGPLTQRRSDRASRPEEMPQYGRDTVIGTTSAQAAPDPLEQMAREDARREIAAERARLDRDMRDGRLNRVEYRRRMRELERRAEGLGIEVEEFE